MRNIHTIMAAGLLVAAGTQAALITAGVNWEAVDLGASGETSQFTVTVAADGNDWLYTWTKTGDLDGLGTSNDTLSFDLRSSAYTGSTWDGTDLTLGTPFDYSAGGTVTTPADQHFGPDYDLDNNQSFQLSIENISFTQGEGLGWVATFDGFTAISRYVAAINDTFYVGTTGAEVFTTTDTSANMAFASLPVDVLTVTATDNNNRFRDLDFSFTAAIPEPATLGLIAFAGVGVLTIRRFIQM